MDVTGGLTAAQRAQWARDGYLVLPDFKSASEIRALRQRALEIVEAWDPQGRASIFATHDQARLSADEAFFASGQGIHCFFEEEAFDAQGQLRQAKALSINKIGHALHDLDPVFEAFSHGAALATVARELGLAQPQVWQSMFIFKQPGIGGEVRWHQDATFLHTTPQSVIGFWFALEDATCDNGCLWVAPGEHSGPLRERFVRERFVREPQTQAGQPLTRLDVLDPTPWPDEQQAVALEVPAGTLVCLHGLLPHFSATNRSAHSRHAYTLHAVEGAAEYSAHNWLQRDAALPLRGFAE